MLNKKQLKIFTLIIGQTGIMLSFYSLYAQNIFIQAIAQVIAALSSLLWVSLIRKKATFLSFVSIGCCIAAVFFTSPWLLFAAGTSRAIDYQIILIKTEV